MIEDGTTPDTGDEAVADADPEPAPEAPPAAEAAPEPDASPTTAEDDAAVSTPAPEIAPPAAAPPFVDRAHPPRLARAGGLVALVGAAFAEGVAVRIANETLSVERVDASLLRVLVGPRDALGPTTLHIENPDGAATSVSIEIVPGPRIDRVSPAEGPRAGGTEVALEGDGFDRDAAIAFFDEHAPPVTFDGPKRLLFTTPPRAHVGAGDVVVTNPDGTSFRAPAAFSYRDPDPPRVDSIEPARAWVSGGARLTVRGASFSPGCVVRIGDADAITTFETAERLVAIAPAGAAVGPAIVAVTNTDGSTATAGDAFCYEKVPAPPKLIHVAPDRGPTSGGQTVMLTGDNFDASTIVRIGEVSVPSRLLGPTRLEIVTPAREAPGLVAIDLVAEGVVVRRDDVYVYEARPAPRVASVAPSRGPAAGGTKIVVEGEHFAADCAVRVGRELVPSKTFRSPERLEATTPPTKTPGAADVEIVAPGMPPSVLKNAFFYETAPPPVIGSVAPQRGGIAGGTEISIDGKAFVAGCVVTVGGKACKKVKLVDATSIEAITPPGEHGQMVDVAVKNPDGKEAVAKRAFQYDQRYR